MTYEIRETINITRHTKYEIRETPNAKQDMGIEIRVATRHKHLQNDRKYIRNGKQEPRDSIWYDIRITRYEIRKTKNAKHYKQHTKNEKQKTRDDIRGHEIC